MHTLTACLFLQSALPLAQDFFPCFRPKKATFVGRILGPLSGLESGTGFPRRNENELGSPPQHFLGAEELVDAFLHFFLANNTLQKAVLSGRQLSCVQVFSEYTEDP